LAKYLLLNRICGIDFFACHVDKIVPFAYSSVKQETARGCASENPSYPDQETGACAAIPFLNERTNAESTHLLTNL
jgi:hypothetical protein